MSVVSRWAHRNLIERGGLVALAALAFYGWFACPYIVENDNAEFSALGAVGGIAHPSGYPLTVLWLRAWSWLPVSSPAHGAAIATAVVGAMTVLVLHAAARAWGARPLAATLAVGLFATAPLVARYSTVAEAFALNNLVIACVLWLAAVRGPVRGVWRCALLGLVAGLGLSNHMTCALAAPVGILGVVRGAREAGTLRGLIAVIGSFVLGLTPYLYLFIAPDHALSWRHPETFGDLADIVLRQQFGGPFGFAGLGGHGDWKEQVVAVMATLARSWVWIGLALGLAAFGRGIARRHKDGDTRFGWAMLATSFVVAGPFLATRFDLPLDMWGRYVVERFHLVPILLLVIPVAAGLDWIGERLSSALPRVRLAKLSPVIGLVLLVSAMRTLPYLQRFHSPAMENEVRNTLSSLPPNAVVLGRDSELDVGFRYLQLACGERPDVLYIRWGTMHLDWYRARFARDGFVFELTPGDLRRNLANAVLATGRPLFVAAQDAASLEPLQLYPYGILVRALPAGQPFPSVAEVFALNRKLFDGFALDYVRPGPDDEYATWAHLNYARVWQRIGDEASRAGLANEARMSYELMRALTPSRP
jgi:Protein of unknown function (DUF2723)